MQSLDLNYLWLTWVGDVSHPGEAEGGGEVETSEPGAGVECDPATVLGQDNLLVLGSSSLLSLSSSLPSSLSPRKDRTPSHTPAHSWAHSTRRCAGGRGGGTSWENKRIRTFSMRWRTTRAWVPTWRGVSCARSLGGVSSSCRCEGRGHPAPAQPPPAPAVRIRSDSISKIWYG